MPTYITLLRWTPQGMQHIKESPAQLDRAKEAIKAAGGELRAFYLTMGQYDAVTLSEAPNDEAYARAVLAIGSAGAVRTETLRAFPEEDYRRIIAALP
jgi:uncharacterized protein with GYD domain